MSLKNAVVETIEQCGPATTTAIAARLGVPRHDAMCAVKYASRIGLIHCEPGVVPRVWALGPKPPAAPALQPRRIASVWELGMEIA